MAVAAVQPQTRDVGPRLDRIAGAFQENELHEPGEFVDVFPKMQLGQLVAADHPVEFVIGIKASKVPRRIDGVADAAAPELDIRNLKPVIPLDGRPQHGEPILR